MAMEITKPDEQWRRELTPQQYDVLRRKGTETPFGGRYVYAEDDGMYRCAASGSALFSWDTKFDSARDGRASPNRLWPRTSNCERTAACSCGVPKSSAPHAADTSDTCSTAGQLAPRYCINSVSLELDPSSDEPSDTSNRG
jgi:peptide-methionine (R)-S-oxide reductase